MLQNLIKMFCAVLAVAGSTVNAQHYGTTVAPAPTVQAGWDNHFSAFAGQDLNGILQDYTETSILNIYDAGSGVKRQYVGLSEIGDAFTALFAQLTDLSGLAAPVVEVDEVRGEVFLVWECPSSGVRKATDTFSFVGSKIMAQTFAIYPTDGASPVQPVGLTIGSPMTGDTGNGGIVDNAINHHYGAFFGADLAATLEDYADNIEFNTHDLRTGVTTTCTGMTCVSNSFAPLYDMDRSVIALDFTNTNEADAATGFGGVVLLHFSWPGYFTTWKDTFVFDNTGKIKVQNAVFESVDPADRGGYGEQGSKGMGGEGGSKGERGSKGEKGSKGMGVKGSMMDGEAGASSSSSAAVAVAAGLVMVAGIVGITVRRARMGAGYTSVSAHPMHVRLGVLGFSRRSCPFALRFWDDEFRFDIDVNVTTCLPFVVIV